MVFYRTAGLGAGGMGAGTGGGVSAQEKDAARLCGTGSLSCCAASLCMVVFGLAHYADIEDVSAFLDTANAFRLCSGTLLLGTLVLNGLALVLRFRKRDAV